MAANDLPLLVPTSTLFVFPATGTGAPASHFYSVSVALASLSLTQYAGVVGTPQVEVLHRYEVATYSGGPDPTNIVALTALAQQAAKDWYLWQLGKLDQYFCGIVEWTTEGYHDLEWRQRDQRITTRVDRGVYNDMADLIYRAAGIHSTEPPPPCDRSTFVEDRTFCKPSPTIPGAFTLQDWQRTVTVGCGLPTVYGAYTFTEDLRTPCGAGLPCKGTVGVTTVQVGTACISLILYEYLQDITLAYDANGCLKYGYGPIRAVAVGCCAPCDTHSGSSSSGSDECPPDCSFCMPTTTPDHWTTTLAGFICGTGCPPCTFIGSGTPASWTIAVAGFDAIPCTNFNNIWTLTEQGGPCEWHQTIGDATVSLSTGGRPGSIVVTFISGVTAEAVYFDQNQVIPDCCSAVTIPYFDGDACGGSKPLAITATPVDCTSSTINPNGTYTLLHTSPCEWVANDGTTAIVYSIFTDPDSGFSYWLVNIYNVDPKFSLAQYASPPIKFPLNCCEDVTVFLTATTCSAAPPTLTFTPFGCPCPSGSGSVGGIDTPCCPDPIASVLHLSVTQLGSGCIGLDGAQATLTYIGMVGSDYVWEGEDDSACALTWRLICNGAAFGIAVFTHGIPVSCATTLITSVTQCPPDFSCHTQINFAADNTCCAPCTTIMVTVTE